MIFVNLEWYKKLFVIIVTSLLLGACSSGGSDNPGGNTVSIGDASVVEGDNGTSDLVFTVSLNQSSLTSVSIDYTTRDGSAKAGSDYIAQADTLTIPANTSSAQILVPVIGETEPESDETFSLILNNPSADVTIDNGTAIGTIINDETSALPVISISGGEVIELDSRLDYARLDYTISLSSAAIGDVTVEYYTASELAANSASQIFDYVPTSGTATIPQGATSTTVSVNIVGDTDIEQDETVGLYLRNASANAILPALTSAQGIIKSNDFDVTINDASVVEGDAGLTQMIFTASIHRQALENITVDYATRNGTANAVDDYIVALGTVTIAAGSTTGQFSVSVVGDLTGEGYENFYVDFSNPVGAGLVNNNATGSIADDDLLLRAFPNHLRSINEGDPGAERVYRVSLEGGTAQSTVTVDYTTKDGTATGGVDYEIQQGTLEFLPSGESIQYITVPITDDIKNEPDETFSLVISNAVGADISTFWNDQDITIVDDDRPTINVADASVIEGDTGASNLNFTVTLSEATDISVSFDYVTYQATPISAESGIDFSSVRGTVTIAPNETSSVVSVPIMGDLEIEFDEVFTFSISRLNLVGATFGDGEATGTITNNDKPEVNIRDVSVFEGTTISSTLKVPVSLSAPISENVTMDYVLNEATATPDADYDPVPVTVTILAGSTTAYISVPLVKDDVEEPDESFTVSLTNVSTNATVGVSMATAIIENDDSASPLPNRIKLPVTGQHECYDAERVSIDCANTGQDGEYQVGVTWPEPRFTANPNATISDAFTGLIWVADGKLMITRDIGWDTDDVDDGLVTWQHALDYVTKLNAESYLGFNDWRLPNINELRSLTEYGTPHNIPPLYGYGFSNLSGAWSSTTMSTTPENAWRVTMGDGGVLGGAKNSTLYLSVLPVRGDGASSHGVLPITGQTVCYNEPGSIIPCSGTGQDAEFQHGVQWPVTRFNTNMDTTIIDNLTGLVWPANANIMASRNPEWDTENTDGDGAVTWQVALDYVTKLNNEAYLGHSDWRLSNVNELQSLMNGQNNTINWLYSFGFSQIGTQLFGANFWTSDTYRPSLITSQAWIVNFGNSYATAINGGTMNPTSKDTPVKIYVWPVRGGL